MGTTIANSQPAAASHLDGFLSRVSAAQTSLIQAINSNEPLRAAFAEAEAKMILLEEIGPEIAAYLLRFCDPKLDMVEVVNTGDKDRQVRVVALAILNGFVPGKAQFGIHTGKLYIKEDGYRKLFSNLSGCGAPDVQVGHPDLVDLGNGRKVWKVDGVASVTWRGEVFAVECVRDFAIGIPSNSTDHIDGIKTKARRRLLQLLWKKVASVGMDDSEEEYETAPVPVQVVETAKQITQAKPSQDNSTKGPGDPLTVQEKRKATGHAIIRMLSSDPSAAATAQEIWEAMSDAKTAADLEAKCGEYRSIIGGFSDKIQSNVKSYKKELLDQFAEASQEVQ